MGCCGRYICESALHMYAKFGFREYTIKQKAEL